MTDLHHRLERQANLVAAMIDLHHRLERTDGHSTHDAKSALKAKDRRWLSVQVNADMLGLRLLLGQTHLKWR